MNSHHPPRNKDNFVNLVIPPNIYDTQDQLLNYGPPPHDGDTNFYGYVLGGPVNLLDPAGLRIILHGSAGSVLN